MQPDGRDVVTKMRVGILAIVFAVAGCAQEELILTGERLDARAGLASETPSDTPRGPTSISLPPQVTRADWTHRAANPAHDIPHAALRSVPSLAWSTQIGQGEDRRHRITADPVISGGRVFTVDSRARVMAHTTSGGALWSRDVTPAGESPDDASGAGLAVAGARLYVSSGFGDLVALDTATGNVLWRQDLDAAATGAPTVSGGLVYVASRDARGWAIDAATGRVRWTVSGTPSPAGVSGGAAPAVGARFAVFPFSSRELVAAYAEGGTEAWIANVAGTREGRAYASIGDIAGDPVIYGNRVYAGSAAGRTAAFDRDSGDLLWSAEDGAMSPPLVFGGSLFTVTDRAELVRLDASSGDRIWGTELPYYVKARPRNREAVFAHYGPVLAGGRLWVASTDDALRGFDPVSGRLVASIPLPAGAATNPVVAGGTLYVVNEGGQLLAFR